MEHRMKCKVCGKIWCFTDKDIIDNNTNSFMSGIAAIGGIASALGGTTAQQHLNYDIMERNQAKVVDFYQCPNCRSKDVVELSEEEWEEAQTKESFANVRVSINANATTEALLSRIKLLLEDKDWPNANAYCDAVLDAEPENAMAYVYKLMAELRVSEQADLANRKVPFDTKPNYQKAVRFADESLRQMLKGYIAHINKRNEQERLETAEQERLKGEQARLEAERKAEEKRNAAEIRTAKTLQMVAVVLGVVLIAFGGFVAFSSLSTYLQWHNVSALLAFVLAIVFLLNGVWWCLSARKVKSVGKSAIKAPAILSALLIIIFVVWTVVFNMI